MKQKDPNAPYQLHGVNISYFTGKLEAYMRYKDIPHELVDGYDLGKIFFIPALRKCLPLKRRKANGSMTRRRPFNGSKRFIRTRRLRRKARRWHLSPCCLRIMAMNGCGDRPCGGAGCRPCRGVRLARGLCKVRWARRPCGGISPSANRANGCGATA